MSNARIEIYTKHCGTTENISCELDLEEWLRVHYVERRRRHFQKGNNMCKGKEVGKILVYFEKIVCQV